METFVKGTGPGGQKINKVRSCVQLTHLPTGLKVDCQDSRSLTSNRGIARKRLRDKVEHHMNPSESLISRRVAKIQRRKARGVRRAKAKQAQAEQEVGQDKGGG